MKYEEWEMGVRELAKTLHAGQEDDGGNNYVIAHLDPVVRMVKCVSNDRDLITAAYLHDTIEDTKYEYGDLLKQFGKRVADLVNEVTHEGVKDDYGFYFPRLHSQEGIMLKFADRLSNISRMECWSEKRVAQYLKRSKFWKSGEGVKPK